MKHKKRKVKKVDAWRDVKMRLPAEFIKGLSSVRDKDGNAYPLPVARGNAIMNRLAYALEVAQKLAAKIERREDQLARALRLLDKFEERLKQKGIDYADLLEQEEIHDESRVDDANSDDHSESVDPGED